MPSPSRHALTSPGAATPMAHPERPDREAEAEEEEGYGSYPAGGAVGGRSAAVVAATPATSVLSTSSFSPPQPLVLLAVRPLGRVRCCAAIGLEDKQQPCYAVGEGQSPSAST